MPGREGCFLERGGPGVQGSDREDGSHAANETDPSRRPGEDRQGAVEFAGSFGFSPHPDFRHASRLLEGIDPADYPHEFTFGRDGKPFYIQGPNETPTQANAIAQRVEGAGGHYIVVDSPDPDDDEFDFSEDDDLEQDEFPDELP